MNERKTLKEIFSDTQKMYSEHQVLACACAETRKNEKLYPAQEEISFEKNRFSESADVFLSKKRTLEVAADYARKGIKTCVLNFANSFSPGGAVCVARTQEECLCRSSTLYDSLTTQTMIDNFYNKHCQDDNPLGTDDIIFSPGVKVFKTDEIYAELMDESEWFDVDVITCAAPCLFEESDIQEISDDELSALLESRFHKIASVAAANCDDVLILGAFGCGAFRNPPELVARTARKVLTEYAHSFKTVEFAVWCAEYETENYRAFKKIFPSGD